MAAQRILVVSAEPLGAVAAGPALRVRAIENVLSDDGHEVTATDLATLRSRPPTPSFDDSFDCAVVQGSVLHQLPALAAADLPIVVDLYDPFHLEALHRGGDDEVRTLDLVDGALQSLAVQMARGDLFLCASTSQRHLWLGHLAAAGRLNPAQHRADPTLRRLLQIAPFGVDDQPFAPSGRLVDHVPQATGTPTLLWAGGLHDWLDPLTVIDAMPAIRERFPRAQLVLLGGRHPNASIETMSMVGQAERRAQELGLLGSGIFLVDRWIAANQRADLLADADLGVLAQPDHVETEFSFRTRLLDHLWAGLPTVATIGDDLSRELAVHGAARVVPPGDPLAFATACIDMLGPDRLARTGEKAKARATSHRWEDMLVPLRNFVAQPTVAIDRSTAATRRMIDTIASSTAREQTSVLSRAQRHLDVGGAKQLATKSTEAAKDQLAARLAKLRDR